MIKIEKWDKSTQEDIQKEITAKPVPFISNESQTMKYKNYNTYLICYYTYKLMLKKRKTSWWLYEMMYKHIWGNPYLYTNKDYDETRQRKGRKDKKLM
jgi:hypothetical protein